MYLENEIFSTFTVNILQIKHIFLDNNCRTYDISSYIFHTFFDIIYKRPFETRLLYYFHARKNLQSLFTS